MFHRHKFEIVAVHQGTSSRSGGALTEVLYRCHCGVNTTEQFNGHWTVEQLRGETTEGPEIPKTAAWKVHNA